MKVKTDGLDAEIPEDATCLICHKKFKYNDVLKIVPRVIKHDGESVGRATYFHKMCYES